MTETDTTPTVLTGHTSPDTAYVVNDYPYGFVLRCKIRFWLEYKNKHGYRLVSQTTNPKRPSEVWNAPKPSIYHELGVMVLETENEKGIREVTWHALSLSNIDQLESFAVKYAEGLQGEREQKLIADWRVVNKRFAEIKAARLAAAEVKA